MSIERKRHWERVYETKDPAEVSWFQPVPEKSLQLILDSGIERSEPIIDVGGGASTLVDSLLKEHFEDITVLDISSAALGKARCRLAEIAGNVHWIESDVTEFSPPRTYSLWHDRAVFHFLTDPKDRDAYVAVMRKALHNKGQLVLATFGPDGPMRCSGLEIQRYGINQLRETLGAQFELKTHEFDEHRTPDGSNQQFVFSWWQSRV